MRNTFSRQAIPMVWDYAECGIFSNSTGNWMACVEWVCKALEHLPASEPGRALQLDATESINGVPLPIVSTDPPYYDNIGYADLSDFFYIWLRRSVGDIYPSLFRTVLVPKEGELVATPYRFGGDKDKAREFFEDGMRKTFENIREKAHPDYPVTIYYAYKQSESDGAEDGVLLRASRGWEAMLTAAIDAGLQITGTWPIRTELSNRPVALNTNALASSVVLVCRGRASDAPEATRREFLGALRRELPSRLRELQRENIAPVDLAQAAIGPGMAVFSRYSQVLEADGSRMSVREALRIINGVLDEVLNEQEWEYDGDTRWAVAWYEAYGYEEQAYGEADVLARAKNTSVEGMEEAGIVRALRGKVRLLRREELAKGWEAGRDRRLTVWEGVQRMIERLEEKGEEGAGRLLRELESAGVSGDVIRDLAYRLYTLCERKGWTEEALAYNSLVVSWPQIVARAGSGTQQSSLL